MKRWVVGALLGLLAAGPGYAQQVSLPSSVRSFGAAGVSSVASPQSSGQPLKLFSVSVSASSAGYLMVFDSASVPASGTVAFPLLRYCAPVASATPYGFSWSIPDLFASAVVVAYSSTGCGTFTPATALWLGGQAQ